MKRIFCGIVLLIFFVYYSPGKVFADEIANLRSQIKTMEDTIAALKARVDALEGEQKAQAKSVEKVPQIQEEVKILKEAPKKTKGLLEGISVGGHLKLFAFDRSEGKRNGAGQHDNISAGINHLYLYFRKEIEEWLGLDVETDTSVTASATPALGSDISRSSSSSVSTTIHQAYMTLRLPHQFEARVGVFNPVFDEDYAKEIWWDELYHQNQGVCRLIAWHDAGIELYRNFDFAKWSLPVYLTYLNGNISDALIDNNESKSVLLHVAPELFHGNLRFLGSLSMGKWDPKDKYDLFRWATGMNFKFKNFDILGEYIYSRWDQLSLTPGGTADGTRQGFYIKGLYRFNPKWRGVVQYSLAQLYNIDTNFMRTDKYNVLTFGLDYFLTDSSTIIGQVSIGDGKRSDGSEDLEYIRSTLGWRTTF